MEGFSPDSPFDRADTPEGHGNAGETADSWFHPSRPSGLRHLIWRKVLTCQSELVHVAGRTPTHPGNPGLDDSPGLWIAAAREAIEVEVTATDLVRPKASSDAASRGGG